MTSSEVSVEIHETLIRGFKSRKSCPDIQACLTFKEKKGKITHSISSVSLNSKLDSLKLPPENIKKNTDFGSDSILGVFDIKIIIKTPNCTASERLNLSPTDFV